MRNIRTWTSGVAGFLLILSVGCMKIETTVRMNDDGSATITERLNFSKKLLDMASAEDASLQLVTLLSRESSLSRTKQMGKGVSLVSHKMQDSEKGSKESVSVYKITDIQELVYPSPFLAEWKNVGLTKIAITPRYKTTWTGPAGVLSLTAMSNHPGRGKRESLLLGKDAKPPKPPSPLEMQVYRELAPVYRDMFEDFALRVRLEFYTSIHSTRFVHRHRRSAVNYVDLISLTDKDLDKYGYNFLENEEIMMEILRWKLATDARKINFGRFISEHLQSQAENLTLPVFHGGRGSYVYVRPSMPLFKKYFEGKTLDFGDKGGGKRLAKFDEIGARKKK